MLRTSQPWGSDGQRCRRWDGGKRREGRCELQRTFCLVVVIVVKVVVNSQVGNSSSSCSCLLRIVRDGAEIRALGPPNLYAWLPLVSMSPFD